VLFSVRVSGNKLPMTTGIQDVITIHQLPFFVWWSK